MDTLDGNAVAGVLFDLFGRDMTAEGYACTNCGQMGFVAQLVIYLGGPGIVGRCRSCDTILLMLSERPGMYCVDSSGL